MSSAVDQQLLAHLKNGIEAFKKPINISHEQCEQLVRYVSLLAHWNDAYNLTAVRSPLLMITRHILDSLVIAEYVTTNKLLDVGTGPGIPGIPLAIIKPDIHVDLLDSNGKKTRFMQQAKAELGLTNISVFQTRVEKHTGGPYTQIVSRAFASLQEFVKWTEPLLADDGQWLAMKGQYPSEEIQALEREQPSIRVKKSHSLDVPDTEGERHLVILSRHS